MAAGFRIPSKRCSGPALHVVRALPSPGVARSARCPGSCLWEKVLEAPAWVRGSFSLLGVFSGRNLKTRTHFKTYRKACVYTDVSNSSLSFRAFLLFDICIIVFFTLHLKIGFLRILT